MTPWTVAYHAPPSMGFSRQEYGSGLSFPSPEDLSGPGIEPGSPTLQANSLPSETQSTTVGGGLVAKSCPTLSTPWTVVCQAPLPIGFSRQEYWSGLPFPSPEDLPEPGMELVSSHIVR